MANNNKIRNKKRQTKPKATLDQIKSFSRMYNIFTTADSPQSIYYIRNKIHEWMSLYSNPQEMYDALLYPEKYGITVDENNPIEVLIPLDKDVVFPGYQPHLGDREGFSDGSISGYDPMSNIIPEEAVPTSSLTPEEVDTLVQTDNLYKPDFKNTFQFYTYPTVENYIDTSVPSDGVSNVSYDTPDDTPDEVSDDVVPQDYYITSKTIEDFYNDPEYADLWDDQYEYVKEHNFFNYLDPRIGEVLSATGLSPVELYNLMRESREEVEDNVVSDKELDDYVDDQQVTPVIPVTYDGDYFPTTLNTRVYSPAIREELMEEPNLDDDTYSRIYGNRVPSTSTVREKVMLPEEQFINLSDQDKIKYDIDKLSNDNKHRWTLSPQAEALLNYQYELDNPTNELPHPLTYEQWMMHPVSYPNIPQVGVYFGPITRRYVKIGD